MAKKPTGPTKGITLRQGKSNLAVNVVLGNPLLQASAALPNLAKRMFLLALAQIDDRRDTDIPLIVWSTDEFIKAIGLENDGRRYDRIDDVCIDLRQKTFVIVDGKQRYITGFCNWAHIDTEKHTVSIEIHSAIKPYLIDLKTNFTKFQLLMMNNLRGDYSIAILEWLLEVRYQNPSKSGAWYVQLTIVEIRRRLGMLAYDKKGNLVVEKDESDQEKYIVTKYKDWRDFAKRVITPSIKEISEKTCFIVSWEAIKHGKSINSIAFHITPKSEVKEAKKKAIESGENAQLWEDYTILDALLKKAPEDIQIRFQTIEGELLTDALKENQSAKVPQSEELIYTLIHNEVLSRMAPILKAKKPVE